MSLNPSGDGEKSSRKKQLRFANITDRINCFLGEDLSSRRTDVARPSEHSDVSLVYVLEFSGSHARSFWCQQVLSQVRIRFIASANGFNSRTNNLRDLSASAIIIIIYPSRTDVFASDRAGSTRLISLESDTRNHLAFSKNRTRIDDLPRKFNFDFSRKKKGRNFLDQRCISLLETLPTIAEDRPVVPLNEARSPIVSESLRAVRRRPRHGLQIETERMAKVK